MTAIKQIDVQTLKTKLQENHGVLIDVREQDEWDAGHIEGAHHIPKAQLLEQLKAQHIEPQTTLYLHCRSGGRSTQCCNQLITAGFTDVSNVSGGITAWESEGLPVKK